MALYTTLNFWLITVVSVSLFVIELMAFVDALSQPARYFEAAGKWKKNNWVILLGVLALFGLMAIPLLPFGFSFGIFFTMLMVTPAGVYLADVRPEIQSLRR
ncbi:Protein of unknown function [Ruaniaceae bacterium KH17]|nr:Protein of unknown function [Ruaniaceae bacterium KH17]